ncbi:MAG: hypothetical protein KDA42_11735 [Planctomycetales bacterium]|nr:hypothetical protein [Planctomycetales bacterium]
MPANENYAEVLLEEYIISIPFTQRDESGDSWLENVQVRFELAALVEPSQVDKFEELLESRHGRFNDEVIRVCRNLDVNDLRDPGNHFLAIALMEAADSVLGRDIVRQFVVSDFGLELQ